MNSHTNEYDSKERTFFNTKHIRFMSPEALNELGSPGAKDARKFKGANYFHHITKGRVSTKETQKNMNLQLIQKVVEEKQAKEEFLKEQKEQMMCSKSTWDVKQIIRSKNSKWEEKRNLIMGQSQPSLLLFSSLAMINGERDDNEDIEIPEDLSVNSSTLNVDENLVNDIETLRKTYFAKKKNQTASLDFLFRHKNSSPAGYSKIQNPGAISVRTEGESRQKEGKFITPVKPPSNTETRRMYHSQTPSLFHNLFVKNSMKDPGQYLTVAKVYNQQNNVFTNNSEKERYHRSLKEIEKIRDFIQGDPKNSKAYMKAFINKNFGQKSQEFISGVTDEEFEHFLEFLMSGEEIDPKKTLKQIILEKVKGEIEIKPSNSKKHYQKDTLRIGKSISGTTERGTFQKYITNLYEQSVMNSKKNYQGGFEKWQQKRATNCAIQELKKKEPEEVEAYLHTYITENSIQEHNSLSPTNRIINASTTQNTLNFTLTPRGQVLSQKEVTDLFSNENPTILKRDKLMLEHVMLDRMRIKQQSKPEPEENINSLHYLDELNMY